MAVFFDGYCYAINQEGIDAYYHSIKPSLLVSATNSIIIEPIKLGSGVWQWKKYTLSNTGGITQQFSVNTVLPVLPSCTPDTSTQWTLADAQALVGIAALILGLAWMIKTARIQILGR